MVGPARNPNTSMFIAWRRRQASGQAIYFPSRRRPLGAKTPIYPNVQELTDARCGRMRSSVFARSTGARAGPGQQEERPEGQARLEVRDRSQQSGRDVLGGAV